MSGTIHAHLEVNFFGEEVSIDVEVQSDNGVTGAVTVHLTPISPMPQSLGRSVEPVEMGMGFFSLPPETAALSALLFAMETTGAASMPTELRTLRTRYGPMPSRELKQSTTPAGPLPGTGTGQPTTVGKGG